MLLHNNFSLLEQKSELLKTLGHPLRLSIVELLVEQERQSVTEIYMALDIEQAVASHHLRIMKSASIVAATKEGKNVFYQLADPAIVDLFEVLFLDTAS